MVKLGKVGKKKSTRTNGIVTKKGAFLDQFSLTANVLGKGSYAEVRTGFDKKTSQKVAVKILSKNGMKKKDIKKVYKEVDILKNLRHPNVVRVYEAFEETDYFYVVMEYIGGGELFAKIIAEATALPEKEIAEYIKTCSEALYHCMQKGVVHRDIKPDNILLESPEQGGKIKIADFNLSKVLEKEEINFTIMETKCGTPNYVAPEVLADDPYNYKCDIWSLGVVLYVMLSGGYLPFQPDESADDIRADLLNEVKAGRWDFEPDEAWAEVSPEAKDLVTNMMCRNKDKRFSWPQVLNHKWFKVSGVNNAKPKNLTKMASVNKLRSQMREELAKQATVDAVDMFKMIAGIGMENSNDIGDGSMDDFSN